jgi:hypothetical protein
LAHSRRSASGAFPGRAAAASSEPQAQRPKHNLVLYDEDKDLPGLARIDSRLREAFRAALGKGIEIPQRVIGAFPVRPGRL